MKTVYLLKNICCAACTDKIERAAARLPGVESVSINFFSQKMTVISDGPPPAFETLEKIIRKYEPGALLAKA